MEDFRVARCKYTGRMDYRTAPDSKHRYNRLSPADHRPPGQHRRPGTTPDGPPDRTPGAADPGGGARPASVPTRRRRRPPARRARRVDHNDAVAVRESEPKTTLPVRAASLGRKGDEQSRPFHRPPNRKVASHPRATYYGWIASDLEILFVEAPVAGRSGKSDGTIEKSI